MIEKTSVIQNLGTMLDVLSLNQRIISQNIAHIHTSGYVPLRLDFAETMENIQQGQERNNGQGIDFVLRPQLDQWGSPAKIELDTEMAALSENTVQFQTLLKAINRQYTILSMAVNDGKK